MWKWSICSKNCWHCHGRKVIWLDLRHHRSWWNVSHKPLFSLRLCHVHVPLVAVFKPCLHIFVQLSFPDVQMCLTMLSSKLVPLCLNWSMTSFWSVLFHICLSVNLSGRCIFTILREYFWCKPGAYLSCPILCRGLWLRSIQ